MDRSRWDSPHEQTDDDLYPIYASEWASRLLKCMMSPNEDPTVCLDAPGLSNNDGLNMLIPEIVEYIYPSPFNAHRYETGDHWHGPNRVSSVVRISEYIHDFAPLQRRALALIAEKAAKVRAKKNMSELPIIKAKVFDQGPWCESKEELASWKLHTSPMPVEISDAESLKPFFSHIEKCSDAVNWTSITEGIEITHEPGENMEMIEFPKGVLYKDGRMDLCKM